jgi:hypothetical protein
MRKCPDCAEENLNEILFCNHCGRCLLSPDPEERQRSTAMPIQHLQIGEGIAFLDGPIAKPSAAAGLKRKTRADPAVTERWLLVLNLLALILMLEIVRYIILS